MLTRLSHPSTPKMFLFRLKIRFLHVTFRVLHNLVHTLLPQPYLWIFLTVDTIIQPEEELQLETKHSLLSL